MQLVIYLGRPDFPFRGGTLLTALGVKQSILTLFAEEELYWFLHKSSERHNGSVEYYAFPGLFVIQPNRRNKRRDTGRELWQSWDTRPRRALARHQSTF